jgi:hypothetical protein
VSKTGSTTRETSSRKRLSKHLIHPSTWKRNSANFAITEFYEVRTLPSLGPFRSAVLKFIPDSSPYASLVVVGTMVLLLLGKGMYA